MKISHEERNYQVEKLIATSETSRIYVCTDDDGKQHLLTIASAIEQNGDLARAAFVLGKLAQRAEVYEDEHAKQHSDSDKKVLYDWLFPTVIDSFICPSQENRQINILGLKEAEVSEVMPLSNLAKNNLCVDAKSSVWILGRLLKLLGFAHENNIATDAITSANVLIGPERHRVFLLIWDNAMLYDRVPRVVRLQNIKDAAKITLDALGPIALTSLEPGEADYFSFVNDLANGYTHDALMAHEKLYDLVSLAWGIKYHPFTTKNRG